jgi:hypothetical protein
MHLKIMGKRIWIKFKLAVDIVCRPANSRSTDKHNPYKLLYIYSKPPDDGLQICPKHADVD